jgi:hypothetical protein
MTDSSTAIALGGDGEPPHEPNADGKDELADENEINKRKRNSKGEYVETKEQCAKVYTPCCGFSKCTSAEYKHRLEHNARSRDSQPIVNNTTNVAMNDFNNSLPPSLRVTLRDGSVGTQYSHGNVRDHVSKQPSIKRTFCRLPTTLLYLSHAHITKKSAKRTPVTHC